MSTSFPSRMSEDGPGIRKSADHATQQTTDEGTRDGLQLNEKGAKAAGSSSAQPGNLQGKPSAVSAAKKGEGVSKPQTATQRLVSLSKQGLSKATGGGVKAPSASEQTTKGSKGSKVETKIEDATELRVVFPHDPALVPRVDIIAVHDIDESLKKAWIYRKKPKRRANDSRPVYASGGISHDGEGGLGATGSPPPSFSKSRQPAPSARKKTAGDSNVERWLAVSTKATAEEEVPPDPNTSVEVPPDDHGPENPIFAPVEEQAEYSLFSILAPVPEDDDGASGLQPPDDIAWQRSRLRRRPTLPNERKKTDGRLATNTEEEKVSSVGEMGGGRRHNGDVLSDRQSSLDHGLEKRVNWLSDPDMLPSEIPGARVMCYTYRSVEKEASPWRYLNGLAEDLIGRVIQKRTSDRVDYGRVPIVLVGLGFGALIVQRAIYRLDSSSRSDLNPNTDLNMIASVIFLDSPSPKRTTMPLSRSQQTRKTWTQDWLQPGAREPASTKIDIDSLWGKMTDTRLQYKSSMMWHFAPGVTAQKSLLAYVHLFVPKQSKTSHRLSRFEGPNDVDYRSIVDVIKRSLVVKCSSTASDKLGMCLADFLRDQFPVDLVDQRRQTALHIAVRTGRLNAVQRLVYQGKASVTKKDAWGRSPLNIAVSNAANIDRDDDGVVDQDLQKVYTQIINLLLKNGARVDDRDNEGKSPWSYAEGDGNQWIRRLKDRHLIIGSSSTTSGGLESVRPPLPGPQRAACDAFDVILAEVFVRKKRDRLEEAFNFDLASAYDVIYNASAGVSKLLNDSRPPEKDMVVEKVLCRWLHLPSNNEQWVHDLMVSLGIQDASMGGQRHEGSRLVDRYMIPQAKRYKHSHGKANKTQPEPKPRPHRMGSTDSATTVVLGPEDFLSTPDGIRNNQWSKVGKTSLVPEAKTESDAIVIFMPILGFERHRHRKYLAHSFREADQAMQMARFLDDDNPDPKAPVTSQPTRSWTQNQRELDDSSDDESSSGSDKESSGLKPIVRPLTQVLAEIKTRREAQLLSGYLDSKQVKPVHCRRTLDQFSYYMLNSTEARDKGQVSYRWARDPKVCAHAKNRPIVMVDQLWLWAFQDGTVISSSPSTWDGQEDFNLSNVIVKELQYNKDRGVIQTTEHLLHLILRTSVDFFKRKGPANFQFHEVFQSSINKVAERQGRLFNKFRRTTKKLHADTLEPTERKKKIEFLFRLDKETELMVEVMDIQDELTIVKTILSQQQDVLKKLMRLYPKKAEEAAEVGENETTLPGGLGKGELVMLQNLLQLLKDQSPLPAQEEGRLPATQAPRTAFQAVSTGTASDERQPTEGQLPKGQPSKKPRLKGTEKEAEQPKPTAKPAEKKMLKNRDLMYETINIVENNLRVVTDMLAYAGKVESSLENLLDLKQKHANGWEARFAREGSEETQRQGNIILVFTLVTVVFLPLSFIASFLALNIDVFPTDPETGNTSWPLGQASGYLFGFSAVVFIPLTFLALYVNKLITNIKEIYKQILKAISNPEVVLNPDPTPKKTANHDSDEEGTFVNRTIAPSQTTDSRSGRATRSNQDDNEDGDGDGDDEDSVTYASLFGRYFFHTKIPYLRMLWQFRRYRRRSARRQNNRWKDTYVWDYPLRHYRQQVKMALLRGLVAVLALLGSEKHKRVMERDRRRREKKEGGSESSDSDEEGGSSRGGGEREEVDRRDFAGGAARRRKVRRKYPGREAFRVDNLSRDDVSLERWSNQTRSRRSGASFTGEGFDVGGREELSVPPVEERKIGDFSWFKRIRKRGRRGVADEEKEVGTSEMVLEER